MNTAIDTRVPVHLLMHFYVLCRILYLKWYIFMRFYVKRYK